MSSVEPPKKQSTQKNENKENKDLNKDTKIATAETKFVKNINDFCTFGENVITEAYKKKLTKLNPSGIGYAIGYANGKIKDKGGMWIMEDFIKRTYEYWEKIKDKEATYFFDKMGKLIPIIEKEHMDELTKLFSGKDKDGKTYIDVDDIDCFWEYIHAFVKISINHIHKTRKPIDDKKGGYVYSIEYMKDVKLKVSAKLFEMELKL